MKQQQLTILDLVKFIVKHRRFKGCFNDWSISGIAVSFEKALANNMAAYSVDNITGEITGVVIGYPKQPGLFHIAGILTTTDDALKGLMGKFTQFWRGWSISAMRKGRLKIYNTQKLIAKIYGP